VVGGFDSGHRSTCAAEAGGRESAIGVLRTPDSGRKRVGTVFGYHALEVDLETRGEDGSAVTTITPTAPSGGLSLSSTGVHSCLHLASTSKTAGNGAQEEVRERSRRVDGESLWDSRAEVLRGRSSRSCAVH